MRSDDQGVSTVIGAVVILAILGTSLVYVNTSYVPRQGAALELQGAAQTEAALAALSATLRSGVAGPTAFDIPLHAESGAPPLLSGVVLSPVRAMGRADVDPTATRVTVSAVLDAPPGGVPAGDPMRTDLGAGKMRLYLLGNATTGFPLGALTTQVGGAYQKVSEHRVEGGLLLTNRSDGSTALGPAGLLVDASDATVATWRLPVLSGGIQEVSGGSSAQVGLRPGPESALGGGRAYNVSIRLETANLGAWASAMRSAVGTLGIVNQTVSGDIDNGTLDVVILPPAGTPATTRAVELRFWAIRHEVALTQR